jgi:hypothetical protein
VSRDPGKKRVAGKEGKGRIGKMGKNRGLGNRRQKCGIKAGFEKRSDSMQRRPKKGVP